VHTLVVLGIVGALAQLTAGSLGMGYGVLATSALLAAGMTPALASTSVHLAEIGTSAALGLSHWRLGNVDRRLVLGLGLPGAVGAFVGALGLTALSPAVAKVAMACVLVPLGVLLVVRFAVRPTVARVRTRPLPPTVTGTVGLVGGAVDAVGGGGWGPVATTTLLVSGAATPRVVVGSVDASKLLVTVAASSGFVLALGVHGVPFVVVLVLLCTGVAVAPIAAWLVTRLPHAVLGTAAGGLVALVNLGPLLTLADLRPGSSRWIVVALAAVTAATVAHVAVRVRREGRLTTSAGPLDRGEGSGGPDTVVSEAPARG
jgi:uncharacterized membrane protein YfcA